MIRYLAISVLTMFLSCSYAAAEETIKWVSLKTGNERAVAEKKPMIIDFFFGPECPRCESLQKEVYDNPLIAKKIMDDFIPVRVDLKKELSKEEKALGEKYDYKNDCLLLFIDYDSNIIKDRKGKRLCFMDTVNPKEFIDYLDYIKELTKKTEKKPGKN